MAATKLVTVVMAVGASSAAHAQSVTTQAFETAIPFSYNRGRNESVTDRPRPEYEPNGIDIGAFNLKPSLTLSGGFTNNAYQAPTNRNSSAIVTIAPLLVVNSNWAVNALRLEASGNFARYTAIPTRNENGWMVGGLGRLDIGPDQAISIRARTTRLFETPFSGTAVPISRTALPVQTTLVSGMADFKFTRVRLALASDFTRENFLPGEMFAGGVLDRDQFDRNIYRVTGHAEYGLTPDAGIFLQTTYTGTDYRLPFAPGIANRDSTEFKVLAGTSVDLSALIRGSLAVGYIDRRYTSPLYSSVSGLSVDGEIEYFPSQLTTVTLVLRRDIEDSTVTNSSGYFRNSISARIDHEVLRNLLVNIGSDFEHDAYRGIAASADIFRVSAGTAYLMNRGLRFDTNIGYRVRSADALIGPTIREFRATAGLTFRR